MHMILLEKKECNGEPRNTLSNIHNIQEFLFFNKLITTMQVLWLEEWK
jgi:hypothetical protein